MHRTHYARDVGHRKAGLLVFPFHYRSPDADWGYYRGLEILLLVVCRQIRERPCTG